MRSRRTGGPISRDPVTGHTERMAAFLQFFPVSTGKDNLLEQVLNPYTEIGMVTTTYSLSGSLFFEEPDEWNVMAVVFSLDNGEDVQEIRFVFNKV